jgi:hypothetical protein
MNPSNSDQKSKQRRFELSKTFLKYGWMMLAAVLLVALVIFPACTGEGPVESQVLTVSTTDILTQPWNPISGTNWVYDHFLLNSLQDMGVAPDPNTGLYIPWRVDKAEVTVQEDLPVSTSPSDTGWLTLDTAATINVPSEAWGDWDASTQAFDEVGTGVTALTKTVIYYADDIWDVEYHDGSHLSPADFILNWILQFDRAKAASPIYDHSAEANYDAFISHFKGVTFEFDTGGYGAIITVWDDLWYLDADFMVGNYFSFYPVTNLGEVNFEAISLGILAESNGELAFSQSKATANTVEWLNYIGGPSLATLSGDLDDVLDSGSGNYEFIPYEPTLGDYITPAEAKARYQNLQDFYGDNEHFYVGTGPYYLASVDFPGKIVDLKKFTAYNLPGDLFFDILPTPPASSPTNTGAWFDEISVTAQPSQSTAITQLQNDQLDLYAYGSDDADLFTTVQGDSNLHYYSCNGLMDEYTFNPSANETSPFFPATGDMNPFALAAVREAMNKAIDRDYIAGTILGGLGTPQYTTIPGADSDYAKYSSAIGDLETEYATDFASANATIYAAMTAVGNVTFSGGLYRYNGEPIDVRVLIRTEDKRLLLGNYIVTVLGSLGFHTSTTYGTSSELSPTWTGDPNLGTWNVYTGGWSATAISRDDGYLIGWMYTNLAEPYMGPLWGAYNPPASLYDDAVALWINDFADEAGRGALFEDALPLTLQSSYRIFAVTLNAFTSMRSDIFIANDGAAGVTGCWLWAMTVHREASGVPIAPAT